MAEIHFISGKGGVGKSTIAAALASLLEKSGQGPVLLIEVQGSGHSLKILGLKEPQFKNSHVPGHNDLWASRILAKETFRQYFELLIGLNPGGLVSGLKTKIVDLVLDNKIVSAFIDVCPGLEPAVFLGKIHWEATQGKSPEENIPWRHIVVDAPATGHGIMLFKSTFALTQVFRSGPLFKQASAISSYVQEPTVSRFYIVTTAEELPAKEGIEMYHALRNLNLPMPSFIINRFPPDLGEQISNPTHVPKEWIQEMIFEREAYSESHDVLKSLYSQLPGECLKYIVSETYHEHHPLFLEQIRKEFLDQGLVKK